MQLLTLQLAGSFLITLFLIAILSPVARRVGLTDKPDKRKIHDGHIPLIGGIAIYLSMIIILLFWNLVDRTLVYFLAAGGLLVLEGVLDDRFNLNVKLRIAIECIAASIMIIGAGLWIGNLGNLFGFGEIHMPFWIAYPFTLVAVFGILNALNMIDGLDGLASGIGLSALTVLYCFTNNSVTLDIIAPVMISALIAFMLCNLQADSRFPKIFLGDAGSKLIGFALVWTLIETTKSGSRTTGGIEPATALYIIGLPLIDMVATTVRRVKKGVSPFHPDRTHMHHILIRAGFPKKATIIIVLALAFAISLIGLLLEFLNTAESIQLALFFGLYYLYAYNIHKAWKVKKWLERNDFYSWTKSTG